MHVKPSDILVTGRKPRALSATQRKQYVRVFRNAFVRLAVLESAEKWWEVQQRIDEARLLAVAAVVPSTVADPKPFTGASALVAWGLGREVVGAPVTRRVV